MAFCEDLIFLTLKVTIDIDKEGNKCDKVREREFGPNLVSFRLDRYLDPFFVALLTHFNRTYPTLIIQ